MTRRIKLILAAGAALVLTAGAAGVALAQADASASLRATGKVGEQADGYLGLVAAGSGELRAQVDAVNIKRRAFYTDLAGKRGATIEEVGATTACEIFASRVGPGQYYRSADGAWHQRQGNAAVPRPAYCK